MITRLGRLINRYIKAQWPLILAVVGLQTLATVMGLYLPSLNADIIDQGVITADIARIWELGWVMLGFAAIQVSAQILAVLAGARLSMRFGRDLRAALFSQVLSYSAKELNTIGAPSLITRNTTDAYQVQHLVYLTTVIFVSAPITMVGGLYMALQQDIGLSWIVGVAIVVLGGGIGILISFMGPLFREKTMKLTGLIKLIRI